MIKNRIEIIIKNLIYLCISIFWKKDKSIVLMDAWFGQKFADNPRYLYQYLFENKEKLNLSHVVWVTRNSDVNHMLQQMGYESYMIDSKESIYYHKHAYYHIINNSSNGYGKYEGEVLDYYSFRSKRINLWHGVAGKGVGFADKEIIKKEASQKCIHMIKKFLHKFTFWRLIFEKQGGWGNQYILVQSKENRRISDLCFRLPTNRYIISNYPRVCNSVRHTTTEEDILDYISKYEYIFLYLPTFRSNTNCNCNDVVDNIKDILISKNILWIQKRHSGDSNSFNIINTLNSNIITLDINFDINVLMPKITCLVTDYSSCMIDAIYFNKDLIFYVPDFDEYTNNDRGIMFDPEVTMVGPKAYNIDELREILLKYKNISGSRTQKYEQARNLYWSENGKKSLDEIWNDILSQIG